MRKITQHNFVYKYLICTSTYNTGTVLSYCDAGAAPTWAGSATFNLHFKKQDKPRGRVRAAFPSAAVFWTLTWRQHRALPGAERETVQLQSQWCNPIHSNLFESNP